MADITRDEDPVASLLVPDDTSRATLIELFDAFDNAGFGIAHRDGYDAQDAVAYDLTRTSSLNDIVPDPDSPEDYGSAVREMRTHILSGPAFDAAIAVIAAHMTAATQHLIDAESEDPDFGNPDDRSLTDAISKSETQITDALYQGVRGSVEVDV